MQEKRAALAQQHAAVSGELAGVRQEQAALRQENAVLEAVLTVRSASVDILSRAKVGRAQREWGRERYFTASECITLRRRPGR